MVYEDLKILAKSYRPAEPQELPKLAAKYNRRQEREVLELAALASDISVDDVANLGLEPERNPQLIEAVRLLKVNLDDFGSASAESQEGQINRVKGKYFEVLVRDKLNYGESVGDIQLEPGQTATLAESENQPGWDLRIEDANGEVVEELQLKATDNMSYVKQALEKHPEIKVVVPTELDDEASLRDNVIASEVSNKALKYTTDQQLGELSEGTLKNLADNTAEFALDVIPWASAAIIIGSEGGKKLLSRSAFREALRATQRSKGRLLRAGAYSTVRTVLMFTPAGPVAVPTTMALRITEGRFRTLSAAGEHVEQKTQEIRMELERPKSGAGEAV